MAESEDPAQEDRAITNGAGPTTPVVDPETEKTAESVPLLSVDEAVKLIPSTLVQEMEDLLRADFREVRRWQSP